MGLFRGHIILILFVFVTSNFALPASLQILLSRSVSVEARPAAELG